MATPALVTLVVGVAATIFLLVAVVVVVVQRARRAYAQASATLARTEPVLAELAEHQAVTRREAERVAAALERLEESRHARRR